MALGWQLVTYPDTAARQDNAFGFNALRVSPARDYLIAGARKVSGTYLRVEPWATGQQVYDFDPAAESGYTTWFEDESGSSAESMDWLPTADGILLLAFNGVSTEVWLYPYDGSGWVSPTGPFLVPGAVEGSFYGAPQWDPCRQVPYFTTEANSTLGANYRERRLHELDLPAGSLTQVDTSNSLRRFGWALLDVQGVHFSVSYLNSATDVEVRAWDPVSSAPAQQGFGNDSVFRPVFPVPEGGVAEVHPTGVGDNKWWYITGVGVTVHEATHAGLAPGSAFWAAYYAWEAGGSVGEYLGPDPFRINSSEPDTSVCWTNGCRPFFCSTTYPATGDNFAPFSLFELTGFGGACACGQASGIHVGPIVLTEPPPTE
jgi:hypothetical protein